MQNIKKFLIFSIFILSSIECLGKGAFNDAGKAAAQVLAPAAVAASITAFSLDKSLTVIVRLVLPL